MELISGETDYEELGFEFDNEPDLPVPPGTPSEEIHVENNRF